jgi:hypothetical protein
MLSPGHKGTSGSRLPGVVGEEWEGTVRHWLGAVATMLQVRRVATPVLDMV